MLLSELSEEIRSSHMRARNVLLLIAAALSPVVALPSCFTNGTDAGLDIRGRWEEAPELLSAPGAASAVRCRAEGAGARACVDHKASKKGAPVAEAGGRARRFVPETCELDPRDGVARARGLADAIGPHRTVFMLGDSLLMQHKSTLRCELESAGMLVNATGAMVGRAMVMHNSARLAFYRVSHLEHLKKQLYALANDPGASYPCSPPLSSSLSVLLLTAAGVASHGWSRSTPVTSCVWMPHQEKSRSHSGGHIGFALLSSAWGVSAGAGIGQVRPTDVCVFNIGVHYNEQKLYQRELLDYFEAECLQKRCLPCQVRTATR
jgi:hypothetical protein